MFYARLDKQTRRRWLLCFALVFCLHIAFAASMTMLAERKLPVGALDNAVQIDMVASAPSSRNTLAVRSTTPVATLADASVEESAQPVIKDNSLPFAVAPTEERELLVDGGAQSNTRVDQHAADPIEKDGLENDRQYGEISEVGAAAEEAILSAKESWHQRVRSYLEKQKRFPRRALVRQQQGVVRIHVVVDRQGNVISSALVKGSGYDILDRAAIDLFTLASPLPAPPAEVPNSALVMDIPIEFSLR